MRDRAPQIRDYHVDGNRAMIMGKPEGTRTPGGASYNSINAPDRYYLSHVKTRNITGTFQMHDVSHRQTHEVADLRRPYTRRSLVTSAAKPRKITLGS